MQTATDRILPYTRWLGFVILPFLAAAVVLLYLLPSRTDELFAWTIEPPLTAMFLASAYLGGIWFFVQVVRLRAWHRVKNGFPAVVVFAGLMGVATFLHWDRFHFGHISFVTWVVLYVTTPLLALAAILANARQDYREVEEHDFLIPLQPRLVIAIVGILALVTGALLFVVPSALIDIWAWKLTPLTARIIGATMTLPGMVGIWLLGDARWSSFRWVFQAQVFSLVFIVLALVLSRSDLDWSRPVTPVLVGGLVFSLVAYVAFSVWCDRRRN